MHDIKYIRDNFDIFQNYEFTADNRDELKKYLEENGIKTLIQWNGKVYINGNH